MMQAQKNLPVGTLVAGRFRVIRLLGAGGMGAVYEATNESLSSVVALKQHQLEEERLEVFVSEARLLHHLQHPSLPRVWDVFSDDAGHFIVMDFIDGDDLGVLSTKRGRPLPFGEVAYWVGQLLDILVYLHGQEPPVLHRDLKPQNVKLARDGRIMLLDFGLAKGSLGASDGVGRSVFGYTPPYASPEQFYNQGTDPRSDLYSLAMTAYHLLVGQMRKDANQLRIQPGAVGPDPLLPLHQINSEVPERFSRVIHEALAIDPAQRPPSAAAMRDALFPAETTITIPDNAFAVPASRPTLQPRPLPRAHGYEVEEHQHQFTQILDNLTADLEIDRIRDSLGREVLGQFRTRERQIRARLKQPLTLVVLGSFKRGKSTLVNALLGSDVVTMNVTPETITINRITYGPELRVTAHLSEGSRVLLDPRDLAAQRLEQILKQLPHSVNHLTIEAPIEWLQGVMLVDMPGIGDLDWRFDQQVQSYLPEADAILVVVSAVTLISATEQAFLRLAIAPQNFPKLHIVVNMIDTIANDRDVERILSLIDERVRGLFPEASVFGISALDERYRLNGRPRPKPRRAEALAVAFHKLRASIEETVLLNRDIIRIDRAVAQTQELLRWFTEAIERLQQAVEHDEQQLASAIAQYEDQDSDLHRMIEQRHNEIRTAILAMGQETVRWMDEFMGRFDREVIAALPQFKLADIQRHFHFFASDTLSTALNRCVEAHQPLIAALVEEMRGGVQSEIIGVTNAPGATLTSDLGRMAAPMTFKPATWNSLDTIHQVASIAQPFLFGYVGQILISGALVLADRQIDDPRQLSAYQQQLQSALPGLRASLQREILVLYTRVADSVVEQLNVLFEDEISASLATIRQAQTIHEAGAQRVASVKAQCDETLAVIHTALEEMKRFQQQLWPEEPSEVTT